MEKLNVSGVADAETTDSYTASIELSNSCREFYKSRVEATDAFKKRLQSYNNPRQSSKKTSIDISMEKLKSEMAGLMDQDLSLMKQLLNLNEAIEELKFKRLYYTSKDSLCTASSDWSVSDTDMFETEEDVTVLKNANIAASESPMKHNATVVIDNKIDYILKVENTTDCRESNIQIKHGPQSSIDSGYGEPDNVPHRDIEVQI
ncbi:hypothetical protein ScPMuIL_001096 [Solemya velum]